MVKTSKEIIDALAGRIGDDNSDEAISLIEDVTDTIQDLETRAGDSTDWKKKFEDNDKEWREKYKARFLNPDPPKQDEKDDPEDPPKALTYDDLFKEK